MNPSDPSRQGSLFDGGDEGGGAPARPPRSPGPARKPPVPPPRGTPVAGTPVAGTAGVATGGTGAASPRIFSVSRLNGEVRRLLEGTLRTVWVEGEISNLSRPGSGHVYFTLKDARAQVRCAMFRSRAERAPPLADGLEVLVRGQLTLYEARGEYQIQVDAVEETGEGALRRAFEDLKRRLAAEGLFAADRKRALPPLPQRIGVLSSPTGAAVRDILKVLARRFPSVPVRLYPIVVQGDGAAPTIVQMLALARRRRDCDVLVLARGGGSLEDLKAFNDERVARALAACDIPVVSAVGHEVDVTIADLVADQRAPTPSVAAELVVPDRNVWLRDFARLARRLAGAVRRRRDHAAQRLAWLQGRLDQQHPRHRMRQAAQRVDELALRLQRAARAGHASQHRHLLGLDARLQALSPLRRVRDARTRLAALRERLASAGARAVRARREHLDGMARRLAQASPALRVLPAATQSRRTLHARLLTAVRRAVERRAERLASSARTLQAVSPLHTLGRGYAIVERLEAPGTTRTDQAPPSPGPGAGRDAAALIVRRASQVQPGDRIRARLGEGALEARVEQVSAPVGQPDADQADVESHGDGRSDADRPGATPRGGGARNGRRGGR